ncbi:MAG: hypothetical protein R3F42_16295 [Pseudomonadota bacterium]
MPFAIRLGDVATDRLLLNVVTLTDPGSAPLSATVSGGGNIAIDAPSLRVDELPARGLWTVRIRFSGLRPWTGYTYSVTQDGVTLDGSFQTLPDNSQTPFGFIIGTCDGATPRNPTNTHRIIRQLVTNSPVPIVSMFHIDDVHYTDTFTVNDPLTGFHSTGAPQDTGIGADYAKAWAANYGVFESAAKWMLPDRQWVYRNLPCCYSGGDHAIGGNWCRGDANPAAGDRMLKPCIRVPAASRRSYGRNGMPLRPLSTRPAAPRAMVLGKDMGPVRISLWDMSRFIEPYDSRVPTDTPCYGAQQIADHMAFLDVDTHAFKIAMHESGLTQVGQPWLEFHASEAQAWLADMKSRPNLNGVAGNLVSIYGDNHTVHTLKLDDFWAWSAGTLGDANAVGGAGFDAPTRPWGWGGQLQYSEHSDTNIGDRFLHNFILVTVHPEQSPMYLDIAHVDGGRGVVKYAARLYHRASRNQMVAI